MADFKSLRGNRLLLDLPKKEEGKLIVDENTKEALEKEMLKKMNKLRVHSVGTANMEVAVGDYVLVDPAALSKAPLIPLSDEEQVLLVSPFDIIQIW